MFEQDIRLGPGTGTYTQHTFEILIMLLVAFLLGIWLGWLLWNRYKQELEKLRLDHQSLKITYEAMMAELSALKTRHSAMETDNSNLSAQVVSLNRNNANLRDRITQLESELLDTESRNRQVETELGLSYHPDTQIADDVPLEVVDQEEHDLSPIEPDVVAPVVATIPHENNISIHFSEEKPPVALDIAQDPAGKTEISIQFEEPLSTSRENLSASPTAFIVPSAEPDPILVGAAANLQDDLTVVEGIGPKIQMLLNQYGVRTYRQLADTPVERLREILSTAGPQLAMHDPGTWPSQANLAANDQWDALKSIQGFLKGGKKPT